MQHFSKIRAVDDRTDKSFLSHLRDDGFERLRFPFNLRNWASFRQGSDMGFKRGLTE